jgi:hypothetical protein
MNRNFKRREGPGALETIETAVHLLRVAPTGTLATYYAGALPFVLGLLYFWADMSRNPFAPQHAVAAALGLAGLFLWMKFWQAVFALKLRAQLSGETAAPLTLSRAGRILYTQTALQPTALFVLPLALIPALPFAWLYAFYQNLTARADTDAPTLRAALARAWRQALLWPAQNHIILAVIVLFSFFVLVGVCLAGMTLPELIKILFGIETVFSRGGMAMLNTTFFAAMIALTGLCVDPILKAVYVLRVFQGESLQSGEDLRAALKPYAPTARRLAACLVLGVVLTGTLPSRAETAPAPQRVAEAIPPQELDRAINDVIQQRKYTWRMPREQAVESSAAEPGLITRFFQRMGTMFRDAARTVGNWIEKIFRKLFGRMLPAPGSSGYGWIMTKQMLLYGLLAVVVSAVALLWMRSWRKRHHKAGAIATQAIQPVPDLTDEDVGADQLPEDGWTTLARELLARGEFRLALRAFYLASLASLAERNLVSLARFKSNRDYERELQRRAHAFPNLQSVFGENVSAFDRVWYGRHEVTGELVAQFAANVARIKAGGGG